MIKKTLIAFSAIALSAGTLSACGDGGDGGGGTTGGTDGGGGGGGGGTITMGFAQVGAESGWRTANTKSVQESAEEAGIELEFSDAQGKQEQQIANIRTYIQQQVDVIAFSPVVETGFEPVLQEAKAAGIPVILTDRAVEVSDDSLYETFLGSDFVLEGEKAGEWLVEQGDEADVNGDGTVNVVELQGTTGAAPAIDRKEGFESVIEGAGNIEITQSQDGNFTRDEGRQVMESFLQNDPDSIDVLFAHNDDMGLGAMEAIEAAGLTPGEDIKIITIDAVKDGMTALSEGRINFIVECNPLLGPQLMDLAEQVVAGEEVPDRVVTEETTFTPEQAAEVLDQRQY